ncbi:UNVERIFIED_ORG: hypothetical protein LHK14_01595 [Roseateles sp. XES5]|nr:hypothetical protein [Roseateles sp. XES5]
MLRHIFGANTGEAAEALRRKREIVEAMITGRRLPQSVAEGWDQVSHGGLDGMESRRLKQAKIDGRTRDNASVGQIKALIAQTNPDIFGNGPASSNLPMTNAAVEVSPGRASKAGWSLETANRSGNDPSQFGTTGGAMFWRNDRLPNPEAYPKAAGEQPRNMSTSAQARFFRGKIPF